MLRTVGLLVFLLTAQSLAGIHCFQISSDSFDEFEDRVQQLQESGFDVRLGFPGTNELIAYSVQDTGPAFSFVAEHLSEDIPFATLNTPVQKAFAHLCSQEGKQLGPRHNESQGRFAKKETCSLHT